MLSLSRHATASRRAMYNGDKGFALFGALLLVLLLIALASGLALANREMAERSANALIRVRLRARAESAGDSIANGADWAVLSTLDIGASERLNLAGLPRAITVVTRTDSTFYWLYIRSFTGTSERPEAEVRIGLSLATMVDSSGQIKARRLRERAWAELY